MFSHSMLRREAFQLLRRAQVPLLLYAGLLLVIKLVLSGADTLCSGVTYEDLFSSGLSGMFVYILTGLISLLLDLGRVEYCARVRRGERAEYGDLFWGFSYVFRVLSVFFLQAFLISLGFSFFLIPGIILSYRYRFALYILSEDPSLGTIEILRRSGAETAGFKMQIFLLDMSFLGAAFLAMLPIALWPALAPASVPALADALITTLLTFPLLLVTFWSTTAEMALREEILRIKDGSAQF